MPAVLDDRPAHAGRLAGINDVATHLSTMSWNYTPSAPPTNPGPVATSGRWIRPGDSNVDSNGHPEVSSSISSSSPSKRSIPSSAEPSKVGQYVRIRVHCDGNAGM